MRETIQIGKITWTVAEPVKTNLFQQIADRISPIISEKETKPQRKIRLNIWEGLADEWEYERQGIKPEDRPHYSGEDLPTALGIVWAIAQVFLIFIGGLLTVFIGSMAESFCWPGME